ncbi:DMT family protein [Mariniphaga sp.]|uniref:DMT family protein n=1 Tax=Mariniphaga sp. TaxID=1954475 RepID=UPI003563DA8B
MHDFFHNSDLSEGTMKSLYTILLLVLSNTFMTFAWYGHLKFKEIKWFEALPLVAVVLISWGIALFEYFFQVPANRIGFRENGGPFSLVELKVIQEVTTLVVFMGFTLLFFKNETFRLNHLIGFLFLILAVYFIFKK